MICDKEIDKQTLDILTCSWRQAISVNQDVLGIQGLLLQATRCSSAVPTAAAGGGGRSFERFDAIVTKDRRGCDGSPKQREQQRELPGRSAPRR